MSDFVADLIRGVKARLCKHSYLATGPTLISMLPLGQSAPSERLPWRPGRIELTSYEHQLLARLWRELNDELAPQETISESDVLNFALQELQLKLRDSDCEDMLLRLEFHLRSAQQ